MEKLHPLRQYRKDQAISLETLAAELKARGLRASTATLSRVERGKQAPNWEMVAQLKAITNGVLTAEDFLPGARP